METFIYRPRIYFFAITLFIFGACTGSKNAAKPVVVSNTSGLSATIEFVQVTATPAVAPIMSLPTVEPTRDNRELENGQPLAARVNNEPLYLDVYQKQVAKFGAALVSKATPEDVEQQVLDGLLTQMLIEQQAKEFGLAVTDAEVEAVASNVLGQVTAEDIEVWLLQNDLTYPGFLVGLRSQLLSGKVFEHVTQNTPNTAEQIWLRYIRVNDEAVAREVIARLKQGEAFELLASTYSLDGLDAESGGDSGWFARQNGVFPEEVETIAFSLQPGEVSGPIYTSNGLYIIKLEDKDPARLLSDNQLLAHNNRIFANWLNEQQLLATIERFVALH